MSNINISIEDKPYFIFYMNNDIVIYKENNNAVIASCGGQVFYRIKCPAGHHNYQILDFEETILILFGHNKFLLFDKYGERPLYIEFNSLKYGKIVGPIVKSSKNSISFATFNGKVQFVNYNFVDNKRESQSSSWKMSNINNLIINNKRLYSIVDQTFLVCLDALSCETLWSRFESGTIDKGLFYSDKSLFYTSSGILKEYKDGHMSSSLLPLTRFVDIQHMIGRNAYVVNNKNRLACVSLDNNHVNWEVIGDNPIDKTSYSDGIFNGKKTSFFVVQNGTKISIVDISNGKVIYNISIIGLLGFKIINDFIILHLFNGSKIIKISGE